MRRGDPAVSAIARDVGEEPVDVEERRERRPLLRALVDHQRGADAAVRVAAALERAPVGRGAGQHVGEIREGAGGGQREPVAQRLERAGLRLHVVREVRERVPLPHPRLVVDVLVAAGERDRLERDEADLVGVLDGEPDDAAHLVVVDGLHDRDDQAHVDARRVQVLDGAQLHVEQVADLAVRVRLLADAVELQVGDAHARPRRAACANAGSCAKRIPLVAACTLKYPMSRA